MRWGRHSDRKVRQTEGWDGRTHRKKGLTDRLGWTVRQVVGTFKGVGQTSEVGQAFRQEDGMDRQTGLEGQLGREWGGGGMQKSGTDRR